MTTAMFAIALFFAGCSGETQKDEETSKVKDEEKVEVTKEKVTSGKPGNIDDAFVEIYALSLYIAEEAVKMKDPLKPSDRYIKLAEELEKETEKLEKEFGTLDGLYEDDPTKIMKLIQRGGERLIELREERK